VTEKKQGEKPVKKVYEPPRIVWETTFMALMQTTGPPCDPPVGPNCMP